MSQNREDRDRAGVVQGLGERAQGDDAAIAALVEKARG
jgi:predicted FMN-binding regulatory protein PaiB